MGVASDVNCEPDELVGGTSDCRNCDTKGKSSLRCSIGYEMK